MLSQNLTERVLSELVYDDDLVLMSETIVAFMNFLQWKLVVGMRV